MSTATANVYHTMLHTIRRAGSRRPLLICGHSFMKQPLYDELIHTPEIQAVPFHDYTPNPSYESVLKGLRLFQDRHCDMLISVGGGSPMDVAKSIKAFSGMDLDRPCTEQPIIPNAIPHLAVPTTAGTGSEATHFAVIYYQGKKYSVSDASLTPDYTVLHPALLTSLPAYQRKATMLDALGHAIESYWSIKATPSSQKLASQAISLFLISYAGYMKNTPAGNAAMLQAAHLAGQAIDQTTTTAAHAMSYKLTSLYGIAHGHAVGLCLPAVWRYMLSHMEQVCDSRGAAYTASVFDQLADLLGQPSPDDAVLFLETLLRKLDMSAPSLHSSEELHTLAASVNPQRLSNNPVALSYTDLQDIYTAIFASS